MDIDVSTRELLKIALLPPGILLALLLLGWLFARLWLGRFVILVTTVLFYALSTPAGVGWLAERLETVPAKTPEQLRGSRADAIWVLLAGISRDNPERNGGEWLSPLSLQRIDYALTLHRRTGLPIALSGGSVKPDTRPVADVAAEWLREQAGIEPLMIDSASRDTWENARESAGLFTARGIHRVLLVTHAFHMPRAMLSAQAAGIDAVAAPFAFEHVPPALRRPMTYEDWLPTPGYLGRSYLMLHEMTGLVWYGYFRD